jgi:hypothetical protein
MSSKKPESLDDTTTTMRVSRKALAIIQRMAPWKNLGISEYIDHLLRTQGAKDFEDMKKEFLNSTYSLDLKTPLQ